VRDNPAKLRGLADYLEHWPARRRAAMEALEQFAFAQTPSAAEMLMYREAGASVRLDRDETHVVQ
jgi:hypothetical protein